MKYVLNGLPVEIQPLLQHLDALGPVSFRENHPPAHTIAYLHEPAIRPIMYR